jgi:hypothetical protein
MKMCHDEDYEEKDRRLLTSLLGLPSRGGCLMKRHPNSEGRRVRENIDAKIQRPSFTLSH